MAFLLGFGLWACSRFVAGVSEPWDADWPFYTGAMLAGGATLGAAWPGRGGLVFLGLWAGQALGLLLPGHDRTWFLLGAFTAGIGSVLGLAAYLAASLARLAWDCQSRRNRSDRDDADERP